MYAVIATGGKQYRVQPGDILEVEKLEGDVGSSVKFDQVLFASKGGEAGQIWLGKPTLSGASVQAEIVGQGRGEKIVIVKMKRRKQYRRTQGHRQWLTQLLVTGVDSGAGEKASLSSEDKQKKMSTFRTSLTPKGEAFTPKQIKTRWTGEAKSAAPAEGGEAKAKKPAAAKKKVATKKASK